MEFQPPAELRKLGSFGEVVSWAISAWAPSDGPRSVREMADVGLVRESSTVATAGADIAANNHAKWYVLLGQSGLENFRELSLRRDRTWRNAETEASKVTRRWFEDPGAGTEKVDYLAWGLLLPVEVAAWIRDRRRSLRGPAAPFSPVSVMAAIEATRDLVRDHRIFDSWLAGLRSALTAPASWQPTWAQDIPRLSLPALTGQPLTVVTGGMGSGKSRYIRQQLAGYIQNLPAVGPVRRIVPLIVEAERISVLAADTDPWASAVRAFVADHSSALSVEERDRLTDLLVTQSRNGNIRVVAACDGLDELPHTTLMRLLDQSSGIITRFMRAESASIILGVRSGTDAERMVEAFADSPTGGRDNFIRVSGLTREELTALARAWRVSLPPHHLDGFLARHPTALLAACALATGTIEQNDSALLESVVRRLLAGEWKTAADVAPGRMDQALAAAANVAFSMAADQTEWRYSASAAWVRSRVTTLAGEALLTVVERLLPGLLQQHAHEVSWVHAAVQEFLVGWHLCNTVPGAEAREFLRRRWWQHAQWRRVTVHTVASANDPAPLLDLLAGEARTDPFAVLSRLLLECAGVVPVPTSVKDEALTRLRSQAKAMVPISGRLSTRHDSPPDGFGHTPELLRSLGANAFAEFVAADFFFLPSGWQEPSEPVSPRISPLFLSALRAGVPVAVHLFRQLAGLMSPLVPLPRIGYMSGSDEVISAAAPWIETSELLLLNDPSREHPWITHEGQFAIAAELWARGSKAHISRLSQNADIGPLIANLDPAETADLLSLSCRVSSPEGQCSQNVLTPYAGSAIERSSTEDLITLLNERSITAPVRVAAALQLLRRGETMDPEWASRKCVTLPLAHRCDRGDSSRGRDLAIEFLDALLADRRFGWAEDLLAETTSVSAVLALARNGRQTAARTVFNRVLAESSEWGLELLPLLDIDLDLTESEIVKVLQHTGHSGEHNREETSEQIYRALRRLRPDARRAVWNYAAPDGQVRAYVEAGYVIWERMLHEVLSLDELRDAVRSARTIRDAIQVLRAVLQISPPDARLLAVEISDEAWDTHVAECQSHLHCNLFAGLSELFPAAIRDHVAIHGDGLKLISAGRYDLIQQWRPPNQSFLGQIHWHSSLARTLAVDSVGLERLKELALVDDRYEAALAYVNPMAGRSVSESRVISQMVPMDDNRAYRMLKSGSPLAIDWYVHAISKSNKDSIPWSPDRTADSGTGIAAMRRLLAEWISVTDAEVKANLAVAMYDLWDYWSESLTDEGASEIRGSLALHAEGIAESLASLAPATVIGGKRGRSRSDRSQP